MAMKEVEKAMIKKGPTGKENDPGPDNVKKKIKEEKPATKVVVRRLPPTMTEEQFKLQVSPLPEIDYFYFVSPDMTLVPNTFSRAYLNFVDQNDLFIFTDKFDGYVFIDSKGGEYPAIVEFAPFQRIPKNRPNRKKDSKMGTIETDPIYTAFKERLEAENLEKKATANASKQHFFETSLDSEKKEMNNTPLLDYIRNKRVERQRLRDEKREEKRKKDLERRRAKEEQRQKTKKDEDLPVVKTDIYKPSPQMAIPKDNECLVTKEDVVTKNGKKNCHIHNINLKRIASDSRQTIPKKVRELVNFFNNSMSNNQNSCISNDNLLISNCQEHKAVEIEIIKKTGNKSVNQMSKVILPKRVHSNTWNDSMFEDDDNLLYSQNVESFEHHYNNPHSPGERDVMSYPKTLSRMYHHSDVVFKPIKVTLCVTPPQQIREKFSSPRNKANKSSRKYDLSDKKLKTSLVKAVEDVLCNSKVNNIKVDSPMNKPNSLMQRVIHECGGKFTNSVSSCPGFFLPRTYGCAMSEANSRLKNDYAKSDNHASLFKTLSPANGRFQTQKNPLPPFSKKSASVSKSDGGIDKVDEVSDAAKKGGSEERIKNKVKVFNKDDFARQPYIAPKKSLFVGDHHKVSL